MFCGSPNVQMTFVLNECLVTTLTGIDRNLNFFYILEMNKNVIKRTADVIDDKPFRDLLSQTMNRKQIASAVQIFTENNVLNRFNCDF